MKKSYVYLLTAGFSLFLVQDAFTNVGGAPGGHSGSPSSSNNSCARAGCHSGGPAQGAQTVLISSNIPTDGFKEDSVYQVTITASSGGAANSEVGFQASLESASGHEGQITATNATATRTIGSFITHRSAGTNASGGTISWSFDWDAKQAPDQTTVYTAVNFTNDNGSTSGDVIVSQSLALDKNLGIGTQEVAIEQLTAYPNPASKELFITASGRLEAPFTAISTNGACFDVVSEDMGAKHHRFNTSELPAGLYVFRDGSGQQIRFSKL
jgi:hypothetical protein